MKHNGKHATSKINTGQVFNLLHAQSLLVQQHVVDRAVFNADVGQDSWENQKRNDKDAVPALISALTDNGQPEDYPVRKFAASALGDIGPAAKEAIPALVTVLKNGKERIVRVYAAESLGKIGPAALPALITSLKDKDNFVRVNAAVALGKIGPAAKPSHKHSAGQHENDNKQQCKTFIGKPEYPLTV